MLLVDDSEPDEALLVRELRKRGSEVIHRRVQDAGGMRDALQAENWDVVLSDSSMPGFSASAALSVLHETGVDIPFIIVSGTMGEEIATAMMRAGADEYILKGDVVALMSAIDRQLRKAAIRREQRRISTTSLGESESSLEAGDDALARELWALLARVRRARDATAQPAWEDLSRERRRELRDFAREIRGRFSALAGEPGETE